MEVNRPIIFLPHLQYKPLYPTHNIENIDIKHSNKLYIVTLYVTMQTASLQTIRLIILNK